MFPSPPPVFRQGDIGTSWYAVLSGSLDVKVSETANHQVRPHQQTQNTASVFGQNQEALGSRPDVCGVPVGVIEPNALTATLLVNDVK